MPRSREAKPASARREGEGAGGIVPRYADLGLLPYLIYMRKRYEEASKLYQRTYSSYK